MSNGRPRVSIVVQRYGEEVSGGAELHARWLAERLTELADVQVITTCALEYATWANHFAPGVTRLNDVTVHRFPVDRPRDPRRSAALAKQVVLTEPSLDVQLAWMEAQGPLSTPLLRFIRESAATTDVFIFFTYLYATTFLGLPLVARKSILVPTAHDEPFIYLPLMRRTFHLPAAIAYNTAAERDLVNRVSDNAGVPLEAIVGIGVNEPADVDGARFRRDAGVEGDFLLYVGRVDESKNVDQLFAHFLALRKRLAHPLKLVVGGRGPAHIPDHPDIISLGFVSEQTKFDAIEAALAVVMPSKYESLSMIVLESWTRATPVIVNGACDVLRQQVRRSHGGLYYTSALEFERIVGRLLESAPLRRKIGLQGRAFFERQYAWDVILSKFGALLQTVRESSEH